MNKTIIAVVASLATGLLAGWGLASAASRMQGDSPAEAGKRAEPVGHEEHGPEQGDEHGHPPEREADEHGEHGHDPHAEEASRPGAIADSMLAPSGIALDTAGPASLAETIALSGRIRVDPARTAVATARFAGVVRLFALVVGSKVDSGDLVAIVESDATLEPYEIRAPRGGTVLHVDAAAGRGVFAGQALAEIADLRVVLAELKVGSGDFARVRAGLPVWIGTGGDDPGSRAVVSAVLPGVDPATQMRTVRVRLDDPRGRYGEGLFVQGAVETGRGEVALAVPRAALQESRGRSVVYVRAGERFEERVVRTGRRDARRVEILFGLERGERVAASGSFVVKADLGKGEAAHEH